MALEQLKLKNQVCFPVYAASRLITREYQPFLEKLGITYPQYLVLLILWEQDGLAITEITQKLYLDTNTVTPLLKRMEAMGLVERQRSREDERKVLVSLTDKGRQLETEAASMPLDLVDGLVSADMPLESLLQLRDRLTALIGTLAAKTT